MTVPLELRNDFNDNRDNSDQHDNNDNDENDNVNSDNLNPHDNSDDLLDKTGLRENRKSKRITAIICSLNDENFEYESNWGNVERFIILGLHLEFMLFVHEPLSHDFFISYGFSMYILHTSIDD